MVGLVDWSKVEVKEKSNFSADGDSIFLKFGPGKFKVRCIGQPYFFLQTFNPKKLTGAERDIAVISPGDDKDPLIKLGITPQQRGAINVLLRGSTKEAPSEMKVMRFGASVYKHIRNYAVETGIAPSHLKAGIDFLINVEDPGGNPRNRQYSVTALNNTPITAEEATYIKGLGGMHDLTKFFSPTHLEKINEHIEQYGLAESSSKVDGEAEFEDSGKVEADSGAKKSSPAKDEDDEYAF
jgi:hypothetical protein